jgi:hypothetical protein
MPASSHTRGIVLCALAALGETELCAQEQELRAGAVRVKADAPLMAAPKPGAAMLRKVQAGSELRWLDGKKSGAYFRVLGPKGPVGWVKANKLEIIAPPPAMPAAAGAGVIEAAPACQPDLASCPVEGCAAPGSSHAAVNKQKRNVPTGSALRLGFEDFTTLQAQAEDLVGQGHGLTADERAALRDLTVSVGTAAEGSKVELTGFIGAGLKPHSNSGESVNCRLKTAKNNDFHISLVEAGGQTEFDGIVVEMTPQDRPAGWTLAKLVRLRTLGRMVKVSGGLFYDNLHSVNNDAANPVGGQPARFSLWEIHPVTEFLVCKKANNSCDPGTASDWKTLESFQ